MSFNDSSAETTGPSLLADPGFSQSILDALSSQVAALDREGRVLAVNLAWSRLMQGSSSSLGCQVGGGFPDGVRRGAGPYGRDAAKVADGVEAVLAGSQRTFTCEFVLGAAKEKRWLLLQATALEGGGALVAHEDVTERKRAEKHVQAASRFRQQLESIIHSVDGVVWEADATTLRFTFVSQQAERILGYPVQRWLDEPGFWREHLHAQDRDWAAEYCRRAVAEGRTHELEYRMVAADGREVWVRDIVTVVCEGGAPAKLRGILVDITKRKQAEEQLRTYAQRLTLATETAKMGVWEWDVRTGEETWDPRMHAMFGVPLAEPMTHARWATLVHPSDLADAERKLKSALERAGPESFSYRVIRLRDGQVRHIQAAVNATRDEQGRVATLLGVNFDITEAKRAEATLRESESRLQMATQAANVGLWDWDFASNRVYFSTEWKRQLGFAPHEVSDQVTEWSSRLHPDDYGPTVAKVEAYRANPRLGYNAEYRMRHKDGAYRWLQARAQMFPDAAGRPLRMLGCHLDITEHKRAEQELHDSNQKLRTLIQVSPLAIVALDAGDMVLMWNPAAEQIFGWTSAEVLGRPAPFVPDENRANFRALLDAGLKGESRSAVEVKCLRRNRSQVDVSLWTVPLRDNEGNISSLLGFIADNTERRSLEEQFRQSQKMEAVGQLAGGVAHDFNNMLTIISGYCEILLATLDERDPSVEMLTEIRKAGERSATLTRQLLAFSRKQVLEPRVIELNTVVDGCESMLQRVVGEDVDLKTALRPGLDRLNADPGQIEHVLMNLVVNARDAMPQGGKITVETDNVTLDATFCHLHAEVAPGPYVMLAVSDTGCGMDQATRERVFEPFFSTKEKGKGTGLGLSIVYGVVKQSGGHLFVYSEVGVGTTFKIYLPAVSTPATAAHPPQARKAMPAGSETILLVEDEDGVRALTRHILESCGYTVLEADSGVAAIRIAERHHGPIDLIVTDVVMPELGGRQAAERVALLVPTIKVLYLSGYTDDAIVRHGVLVSETQFLQKPFTPSTLALKVRKVLDK